MWKICTAILSLPSLSFWIYKRNKHINIQFSSQYNFFIEFRNNNNNNNKLRLMYGMYFFLGFIINYLVLVAIIVDVPYPNPNHLGGSTL